jgi:hypothetical protein
MREIDKKNYGKRGRFETTPRLRWLTPDAHVENIRAPAAVTDAAALRCYMTPTPTLRGE